MEQQEKAILLRSLIQSIRPQVSRLDIVDFSNESQSLSQNLALVSNLLQSSSRELGEVPIRRAAFFFDLSTEHLELS